MSLVEVLEREGEAQSVESGWAIPRAEERSRERQPVDALPLWARALRFWKWATAKPLLGDHGRPR